MTPDIEKLTRDPRAFAVCMGMDAMRLCLGLTPRNFSAADVIRWLRLSSERREGP